MIITPSLTQKNPQVLFLVLEPAAEPTMYAPAADPVLALSMEKRG